jgi:pimeloyl-ACP methyl ester carboxylesterase
MFSTFIFGVFIVFMECNTINGHYNKILMTKSTEIVSYGGFSKMWTHHALVTGQSHQIRYKEDLVTSKVTNKSPILCIHGFGGNADQFRKNTAAFSAEGHDTYSFDLLGYGYSDKPNPKDYKVNEVYNFETWAEQTASFIDSVIGEPAVLVCNSVGGLVGLQTAVKYPEKVKGLVLINISLRMLHTRKQSPLQVPFTTALQTVLRETGIGKAFFERVATPQVLKNILNQAYADNVDDEVVDIILKPGLVPGAADVFLDFISYSSGPLPEDLLPIIAERDDCPIRFLWGENDPWEPIGMGRDAYAQYADEFIPLENGGHCPMDQIPGRVNAEILRFLSDHRL